jgi:hypothetical protein
MLTTRSAKRDKVSAFNTDLMFDILDGDKPKQGFAVGRGEESFSFRKVSRSFHLFRQGSDQSLGSVGQEKFFTRTLRMRLPAEFDPPFQVFLLVLVLNDTMQRLDALTT